MAGGLYFFETRLDEVGEFVVKLEQLWVGGQQMPMGVEGLAVVSDGGSCDLIPHIAHTDFLCSSGYNGVEYFERNTLFAAQLLCNATKAVGEIVDQDSRKVQILPPTEAGAVYM